MALIPPKTNDPFAQDTSHTHSTDPSAGGNAGGPNVSALSLGIGTSTMLLLGGGLFWLYLRRSQPGVVALQKWKNPAPTTNASSWAGNSNLATNNGFLPGSDIFTATIPPIGSSSHENALLLASNEGSAPEANTLQQSIPSSPTEQTGLVYRPGDLRPITAMLPKQVTNQDAPNAMTYLSTSNMNPLPLDALKLPDETTNSVEPEHTPDKSVPATIPENLAPTLERNPSTVTPLENAPLLAAAKKPSVQLPDIVGDLILENVMRQAQIGLFITPGHEKS